jgi:hypothetical protein
MEEYLFVISYSRCFGAYLTAPAGHSAAIQTAMLIFNLFIAIHYYSSTVPKMSILLNAAIVSVIIWDSLSVDFKVGCADRQTILQSHPWKNLKSL